MQRLILSEYMSCQVSSKFPCLFLFIPQRVDRYTAGRGAGRTSTTEYPRTHGRTSIDISIDILVNMSIDKSAETSTCQANISRCIDRHISADSRQRVGRYSVNGAMSTDTQATVERLILTFAANGKIETFAVSLQLCVQWSEIICICNKK